MAKLTRSPLHIVALVLTLVSIIIMLVGMLLPHWWVLEKHMRTTVDTFSHFGEVYCDYEKCFPQYYFPNYTAAHEEELRSVLNNISGNTFTFTLDSGPTYEQDGQALLSVNQGNDVVLDTGSPYKDQKEAIRPLFKNAGKVSNVTAVLKVGVPYSVWLSAGRVLSIMSAVLMGVTFVIQLLFMAVNERKVQVVAFGFLISAALCSFIAGFVIISKFTLLSEVYVTKRIPWTLTYTSGAPGCLLIASLLCTVATVFTIMAFRPPTGEMFLKPKTERRGEPLLQGVKKVPPEGELLREEGN